MSVYGEGGPANPWGNVSERAVPPHDDGVDPAELAAIFRTIDEAESPTQTGGTDQVQADIPDVETDTDLDDQRDRSLDADRAFAATITEPAPRKTPVRRREAVRSIADGYGEYEPIPEDRRYLELIPIQSRVPFGDKFRATVQDLDAAEATIRAQDIELAERQTLLEKEKKRLETAAANVALAAINEYGSNPVVRDTLQLQEKNPDTINRLREKFPASSFMADLYANDLVTALERRVGVLQSAVDAVIGVHKQNTGEELPADANPKFVPGIREKYTNWHLVPALMSTLTAEARLDVMAERVKVEPEPEVRSIWGRKRVKAPEPTWFEEQVDAISAESSLMQEAHDRAAERLGAELEAIRDSILEKRYVTTSDRQSMRNLVAFKDLKQFTRNVDEIVGHEGQEASYEEPEQYYIKGDPRDPLNPNDPIRKVMSALGNARNSGDPMTRRFTGTIIRTDGDGDLEGAFILELELIGGKTTVPAVDDESSSTWLGIRPQHVTSDTLNAYRQFLDNQASVKFIDITEDLPRMLNALFDDVVGPKMTEWRRLEERRERLRQLIQRASPTMEQVLQGKTVELDEGLAQLEELLIHQIAGIAASSAANSEAKGLPSGDAEVIDAESEEHILTEDEEAAHLTVQVPEGSEAAPRYGTYL